MLAYTAHSVSAQLDCVPRQTCSSLLGQEDIFLQVPADAYLSHAQLQRVQLQHNLQDVTLCVQQRLSLSSFVAFIAAACLQVPPSDDDLRKCILGVGTLPEALAGANGMAMAAAASNVGAGLRRRRLCCWMMVIVDAFHGRMWCCSVCGASFVC